MTKRELLGSKKKEGFGFEILIAALGIILALMITFHPSEVDKTSMLPNVDPGDVAIHVSRNVKRGDIVIASGGSSRVIKRAVGIPGDTLEFKKSEEEPSVVLLFINERLQEEDYILERMDAAKLNSYAFLKDNNPVTLKNGEYFLLGDNRNVSLDSRDTGVVKKASIEGVVIAIFPRDSFFANLIKFIYRPERTRDNI